MTDAPVRSICRLCNLLLPQEPIMVLKNVPPQIQYFPTEAELATDRGSDLVAYQCQSCGHIQLNSPPVVYRQGVTSTTIYSKHMLTGRREQVKEFIDAHALGGKRVLDVGCGDGHLLGILGELGADAIGVDASEVALGIARQHNYRVHQVYITHDVAIPDGPFDGFVCYDVIEHVPDIRDFLQGITHNVVTGGVGLIETPSFEKVIETNRFYDFMQDHLSYFTVDTLRLACELSGFDVLHIERNRDEENLTVIVQKRRLPDFGIMRAHQAKLMEQVAQFIGEQRASGRRVAIWGASLQTLTLSSLMKLDVAYIIDSAPYKQNHFTPVSHLPIVSPQTLHNDPVDVVIINAPRYENEIIEQIQRDQAFKGTVAVLKGDGVTLLSGS